MNKVRKWSCINYFTSFNQRQSLYSHVDIKKCCSDEKKPKI